MQTKARISKALFQAIVHEAAGKGAVFTPDSAAIALDYCESASDQLRGQAESLYSGDAERSDWIDDQIVEVRAKQIPKAVNAIVRQAREHRHQEGRFLVLHESDSGGAFSKLCPGFWPFC